MKYFIFIILLVAVTIIAGCTSGNQNITVTSTQPTATNNIASIDQIVGIWQLTANDGSKINTFTFFSDGRYAFTDSSGPNTLTGTWSKVRENEYIINYTNGRYQVLAYNSVTDTYTMPEFPSVVVYRLGKEPVKIVTATAKTVTTLDKIETTPVKTVTTQQTSIITQTMTTPMQSGSVNLVVYSSPSGASIWIDGKYYGITPAQLTNIPTGNHIIRLSLSGYYDYEGTVYVIADQVTHSTGTLKRLNQ